ncbi:SMAD/FHA domain-containing protein, partial [Coemansia mojavensis]
LRIVPHIVDVRKDLFFEVMDREVPENTRLKVGRFTEKVSQQMNRIAFKSKVVSRSHAEVWVENGQFYIQDTKSSSGTFLNHMRLSPPGVESRPHPLHDGDILQLGVDYQGGIQDIYKCVKIRLEINRDWQRNRENPYRQQVLANIQNAYHANSASGGDNNECCICLYQMVAFQALFLAPCSHCFHYKCVKPLLFTSTGFNCPLCRTYADLEASVTIDENEM